MLDHRIKYKYNWKNDFASFPFINTQRRNKTSDLCEPKGIDKRTDYKVELMSVTG